ncbi:MAG: rane protein, partial [Phycisphaerales bacterium]|nr:rane protein [Phycisphaerales bacterium]
VALAAALLFWPAWERQRAPGLLAAALRANRDYAAAVVARLAAGGAYTPAEVKARRSAERANAAALASLARLYADPANRRAGVERAAVLANGNGRLTRALGLLLLRAVPGAVPDSSAQLAAFAAEADAELTALAAAVEADGPTGARGKNGALEKATSVAPGTFGAAAAAAAPATRAAPAGKVTGTGVANELLARARTELDAMRLGAGLATSVSPIDRAPPSPAGRG